MTYDPYNEEILLAEHVVNQADLRVATKEGVFVEQAFELLKEAIVYMVAAAGLRVLGQESGLERNQAIIVGHLARMIELAKSIVRQVADDHGGDQQLSTNREFLESVATILYLMEDVSEKGRFDAYVFDSLIAEREFLKVIHEQVSARGGVRLPIEDRLENSIRDSFHAAGVTEADIPSRKNNNWPSAKTRLDRLGPATYAAYRTGSNAIHGAFADIEKHHLERMGDRFEIELQPLRFRPQPLLTMGALCVMVAHRYLQVYLPNSGTSLEARLVSLGQRLELVDGLHEAYLQR